MDDPSALPPGSLLAGKFRVVRCLGMGGMGAVYEIEHELTKHRRALKLLHAQMAQIPGIVERFLREASAAGRVGNPHIIETFDAGTLDTGEPYLVMEILRGQTLTDRIEQGPMPVADVVDLVGQACDGVQAAHDAGIVHRDLKPDNLFIVEVEWRPFVKLLDFGISKFDPSKTGGMALTQEGAALGTPYYMSPEQIRGETSLDARADTYALGVILYECLAGRRPFEADVLTQLAVLIHTGRPTPLAEIRRDLPRGLADVVARAMASDREQRFAATSELRTALSNYGHITSLSSHRGPSSPSLAMPAASVPPKGLATSATGVSLGATVPERKSAGGAAIGVGFGVLAVIAVAAFFGLRSAPSVAPEPGAASAPPASPPPEAPVATAAPEAVPVAPSASATPPVSPFPLVAPSLAPPPAAQVEPPRATAPKPASAPAAPQPQPAAEAPPRASRAEKRGLAQDNPFR